jgi:hypothetical protein
MRLENVSYEAALDALSNNPPDNPAEFNEARELARDIQDEMDRKEARRRAKAKLINGGGHRKRSKRGSSQSAKNMDYGVMWNIMLQLDKKTLNSMCKVNKLANKICKENLFKKKYEELHPLLIKIGPYKFTDFIIKERDDGYYIIGTQEYSRGKFLKNAAYGISQKEAGAFAKEFGIKIHKPYQPYRNCQNKTCTCRR